MKNQKNKKEIKDKKEEKLDQKERELSKTEAILDKWIPKTTLGKKVKNREIKSIEEVFKSGLRILEPEIVDVLLPNLEYDLMGVGQSKGKFGGGKRSIWKTTQKKTKEGNKPKFTTGSLVGNRDGYIGFSRGKSKETVLAREKATRKAKLNIMQIRRGCGSWACGCGEPHSIPIQVSGKSGSVELTLIPAPKGTGLAVHSELRKVLAFGGIKDVYSKKKGQTKTGLNLIKACINALKKLNKLKIKPEEARRLGILEGRK